MSVDLISVIITCYNYEDHVTNAINSVIAQTYRPLEVIIIDDGSTDNSAARIEAAMATSAAGITFKFISRENKGIVATRNEGLALASGAWLTFLDADDTFDRDYLAKMYQTAIATGADVVYPNWRITFALSGEVTETNFGEFDRTEYQLQHLHVHCAALARTAVVRNMRFREERIAEDWDFFNRLALAGGKFALARDCYLNYLVKPNGRSQQLGFAEDSVEFERMLALWREEFGAENVIPAGRLALERIFELNNSLNATVANKDAVIAALNEHIANLTNELHRAQIGLAELQGQVNSRP